MKAAKHVVLAAIGAMLLAGQAPPAAASSHTHRAEGVVRALDTQAGKIKIEHGPIRSLGWAGMAMVFDVADPGLLKGLKSGDTVAFELAQGKDGRFAVTSITPRR
ncbi:MAG: hypothetical protein A2151_00175 [Candidatus Muproteobacteria bacterium RBG_16_65_34]|uniref:Copper-binding protein n=1 Tax=Candidatus Muproteobacteria bacterium RBG_16_65_34 TaxID=1817760 RepID=A0A1F6TVM8_9PROT|nr:MAG: hypothetical protein A2151_00175 [Candidatus Muproteobacteria bacterium RBG_16_65_34]